MQNLKRLGSTPDDVSDVSDWSLEDLSRNVRQIFTASRPDGALIVCDLASIESRGLAFLADAEWKLSAFRHGKDMYKVLASLMTGVPYDRIDKAQRMMGKVGELSCGYGAGPGAVKDFAEKMGVNLSELGATENVQHW